MNGVRKKVVLVGMALILGLGTGFFIGEYYHPVFAGRDASNGGAGDIAVEVVHTDKPKVWTGKSHARNDELWLVRGKKELLVESRDDKDIKKVIAGISDPVFSLDRTKLYFETDTYATSNAIHVVDIKTKEVKYVFGGSLADVIRDGRHKGKLRVYGRIYFDGGGSEVRPHIIDDNGKVLWMGKEPKRWN